MRIGKLLSIILIVGFLGCSGTDVEVSRVDDANENADKFSAVNLGDSTENEVANKTEPEKPKTPDKPKTELAKAEPDEIEIVDTQPADSDPVNKEPAETEPADSKPAETFAFNHPVFEAPVMLMAGGVPMKAGHSYPSPAMFDVDNDGDIEMVLGEIMGTVSYCENENKSGGDPVWGAVQAVQNAEGKPLKLNNW